MIPAALLALGVDAASAKSRARTVVEPVPAPYACTYVLHPAHNIACDTRYRSTRRCHAIRYGNDLGLGFHRRASEVGSGRG
jgi:hypothetical protein